MQVFLSDSQRCGLIPKAHTQISSNLLHFFSINLKVTRNLAVLENFSNDVCNIFLTVLNKFCQGMPEER